MPLCVPLAPCTPQSPEGTSTAPRRCVLCTNVHSSVYVCIHVSMYTCMEGTSTAPRRCVLCTNVHSSVYVYMYLCIHVWKEQVPLLAGACCVLMVHSSVYVCIHVSMYTCMEGTSTAPRRCVLCTNVHSSVYVCIHVSMYTCMEGTSAAPRRCVLCTNGTLFCVCMYTCTYVYMYGRNKYRPSQVRVVY